MKGLLVRGDPRALSHTENVFGLFSDEAINWDAASSIGKIAAPTEVLTKTNYAVTKVGANLDQLKNRNSPRAIA